MDEKTLEEMLDNLIKEAGMIAIQNMESNDVVDDEAEVEFSEKHKEKMREIFEEARRREIAKTNRENRKIKFTRVAALVAVLVLVGALMTPITSGFRQSFMKYFISEETDEYSKVNNMHGSTAEVGGVYFGYVPKGFKHEIMTDLPSFKLIYFTLGDLYFSLRISKSKWDDKINTESGETEELVVNNNDMLYYENDGLKYLNWKNSGTTFLLNTNCDKETLLYIAEKIEIVDK